VATRKDKKKKRRSGKGGSGSGRLSGMRQGMKSFVGTGGSKKKQSTFSKILTYLLLAAAVGLLIYRFTR